jgi:hypothetical protein
MLAVAAASFSFALAAGEVPFVRKVSYAEQPGNRERTFDRTMIFAQLECYGPHQNMMHRFTNRALYTDIRDRKKDTWTFADFRRDTAICRELCGFDGLGALDYFGSHLWHLRNFETNPPPAGFSMMIVIPGYINVDDPGAYGRLKNMVVEAAKSKYTTRYNGKLLMWSYGGGRDGEAQRKAAKALRADPDIPPFMFVAEMPFYDIYQNYGKYEGDLKNPRPIPAEIVEKYRAKLADFAKDVDGFNIWLLSIHRDHDGEYPSRWIKNGAYRKYLLPIAAEVLSRPENKGKLAGSWVRQGYINPFSGTTDGQFGTETLRNYLDSVVLVNPDLLMCFEWNEANENTHFQPTVAHGRTFARVLGYYRSLIDRTSPVPMPGDDEERPNMVVSVRQAIKLGEPWHCELMYLPDSPGVKSFTASLKLKSQDGRLLKSFPLENFATDRLMVVDYRISSEHFAGEESLVVELETDYLGKRKRWTGFDSTRIRTTACRDYLYSHMPLRELIVPAKTPQFAVKPGEGGIDRITASFDAGEPLRSLEVLDDLEEVAAAIDDENVYDREKYAIIRGRFTVVDSDLFGQGAARPRNGVAWFEGTTNAVLRSAENPWVAFRIRSTDSQGRHKVRINFGGVSTFYALVPKAEIDSAKLVFDIDRYGRVEAELGKAWRLSRYATSLPMTVRLDLDREEKLPDYTKPLLSDAASLAADVRSLNRFPAYQLRAITMSGKIWRSRIVPARRHSPDRKRIEVWSDLDGKKAEAEVFSDAIPDLKYVFDPKYGAHLRNTWEAKYDATLGGGGLYGEPMNSARRLKRFAPGLVDPAPVWTNFEGKAALRFDKGSYLQFPHETILRGAPYTIAFEIRPDDASDQVLIRTSGIGDQEAHFSLIVKDGTLRLTPYGVSYYLYPEFDTKLKVLGGEWNRIAVSRNFEKYTIMVNGETREFGYTRRSRLFQGFSFGGNVAPGKNIPEGIRPFTGFLRAMRVRHLPLNSRKD